DESPDSAPGSESSRTPSPVPFPPISSLRSLHSVTSGIQTPSPRDCEPSMNQSIAAEHTLSPKTIVRKTLGHDMEADIFFNNRDPKDILFGSLQDGEKLPDWIWNQPDYDFDCQLDGLDLGNKITRLYNDVRKQKDLDHTKVDRIA
ncbi:hypothetical protein BG003_011352, partial [Podila horticola]